MPFSVTKPECLLMNPIRGKARGRFWFPVQLFKAGGVGWRVVEDGWAGAREGGCLL